MEPNYTIHLIGNAHIDPVWLWTWQEGFHEVMATFRSALDRMKEFDDFTFTASSAVFYQWVEQSDPCMFAEIRQRVAEGRWAITGGWWIEPDCNIPSGESFARQALYGQRYFQEKFGKISIVGYAIDSFGHNGMLPQLLCLSGMHYYVFMRPMPHEKELPGRLFWWESPDGSRVLAFRLPHSYCTTGGDLNEHIQACAKELSEHSPDIMCFYGVGNHGGGPTIASIESVLRIRCNQQLPYSLEFSTPEGFFKNIRKNEPVLPVVKDDLQHHASGCYAAHSAVKRWNRRAETRLLTAEKWSVIASWKMGIPYPNDFAQAWKDVLFNQFHDILAGTSLESAYDDARDAYGEAMVIAGRNLNQALQAFIWRIHIESVEGMKPIVVFNPLTWRVQAPVELEFDRWQPGTTLIDENDNLILFQSTASATTPWRQRLVFIADVPALGYRTYRMMPPQATGLVSSIELSSHCLIADSHQMENDFFHLKLDPDTGNISSLFDKRHACEVFAGQAARAVVIDDPSDTWSHDVRQFDHVIGEFRLESLSLVENGPVKTVLRAKSFFNKSALIQEFVLYRELSWIEVFVTVNWQEHNQLLKLSFPLNLIQSELTYEIPYGTITRSANGEEEPFQNWLDLSGKVAGTGLNYGLSLLNDSKYSASVHENTIYLTVLRSPAYAHHFPARLQPDGHYNYIDQGIQKFCYILLPHTESWVEAQTAQRAAELNQPLIPMLATFHPEGVMPQVDSFIQVRPENVIVTVLKRAEDNQDWIVRAYETSGKPSQAKIYLPTLKRDIEVFFKAFEIKTFRIPGENEKPIIETNFLEIPG